MEIKINKSYEEYLKYRNIMIICAGDNSLHHQKKWFSKSRQYVLCINYYGDSKEIHDIYKKNSDIFVASKGPKWVIIRNILLNRKVNLKILRDFNFITFPDDDLDLSVSKWNKLFKIGEKYKLDLFQPALIDNGREYITKSHENLIVHPECKLRYINFVEVMAPIFSQKTLHKSLKILCDPNIKSAWGVDYVIAQHVLNFKKIAVIDSVTMIHTRPRGKISNAMGSSFYKTFQIDPFKEMEYFLKKYKVSKFKQKTFKCIKN